MKFIHSLSEILHSIEKILAIILCILMLISLSLGVFYRYFLSSPLNWSDETAIFSLAWLTFIGGSMSIKRQNSAAVTLFMDKMNGKTKKVLIGISLLTVLLFALYIFYLSVMWLSSSNIMIQRSNSMQLPMIIPYLSVPVSFFFISIHTLDLILKNFQGKKEAL